VALSTLQLKAAIHQTDRSLCRRSAVRSEFRIDTPGYLECEDGARRFIWLDNLSERGIGFMYCKPIETGKPVTVTFKTPGDSPLVVEAVVRHSTAGVKWDWLIGCEFVEPLSEMAVKELLRIR